MGLILASPDVTGTAGAASADGGGGGGDPLTFDMFWAFCRRRVLG